MEIEWKSPEPTEYTATSGRPAFKVAAGEESPSTWEISIRRTRNERARWSAIVTRLFETSSVQATANCQTSDEAKAFAEDTLDRLLKAWPELERS